MNLRLITILLALTACTTVQKEEQKLDPIDKALAWESGHPEGKVWSGYLHSAIDSSFETLNRASDFQILCPNYSQFSDSRRKDMVAQFLVELARFESSWNPGTRYFETGLGYDSVGLFQLSVEDESWAKCGLTKSSIVDAKVNIECAVKILARQISKYGKVIVPKGKCYWSPICPGHKNEKIEKLKSNLIGRMNECVK